MNLLGVVGTHFARQRVAGERWYMDAPQPRKSHVSRVLRNSGVRGRRVGYET
jgi:hypothetical protein